MDRKPKRAPFAVGTRLRCVGKHQAFVLDNLTGSKAMIFGPGLEVVVEEVKFGRQGTLRHLRERDGSLMFDDRGDPVLDWTQDWMSIYYVTGADGQKHGRCISREYAKEWERIK